LVTTPSVPKPATRSPVERLRFSMRHSVSVDGVGVAESTPTT
jgi:hypothetical protein